MSEQEGGEGEWGGVGRMTSMLLYGGKATKQLLNSKAWP